MLESQAPPPAALTLAATWRRAVAGLIDVLLLAGPLTLLAWIWIALFHVKLPAGDQPLLDFLVQLAAIRGQGDPMILGGVIFLAAVSGAYVIGCQVVWGATPAMRVLGLSVVDTEGEPPGIGTATTRFAASWISAAYFGLGFVWIAFDLHRQAFHDKLAGTLVVRRS